MEKTRVLAWFSCGVTSAVACKLAVEKYKKSNLELRVIFCDTKSEHDDNYRFMADVEKWINWPIEKLSSDKYEDTFDVYRKTRYLVGVHGARCTTELKKNIRFKIEQPFTDIHIFGFCADEQKRVDRFVINNPETFIEPILIDNGFSKQDCFDLLENDIKIPITYNMGFHNANCLKYGCVKGGKGYWNHIRKIFPVVFDNMASMEREIGHAINRQTRKGTTKPIYLDELDPQSGNYKTEKYFDCGVLCTR